MKNKVRRNLKKNNKFNYKKHWLIFVDGRDFTVDETTPEQDIENFKAWEKLLEDFQTHEIEGRLLKMINESDDNDR